MLDSIWDQEVEAFPRQPLEAVLEPEMVKQYRIRRGEQCKYMPVFSARRYLCSCGGENPVGEACAQCGLQPEVLSRQVMEELSRDAQLRLEQEAAEAARQEAARQAEAEKRRREKLKKRVRIALLSVACAMVALVVTAALFWGATRVWIPARHYKEGLACLEQHRYEEAYHQFSLAGSYRDAQDYLARFETRVLVQTNETDSTYIHAWYSYDGAGRLLFTNQTEYTKTDDGTRHEVGELTWENTYDALGRPLKVEDYFGSEVYAYNEQGDVVDLDVFRPDGIQETTKSFLYQYDEAGRMTRRSEICSELISVNYSYEQIDSFVYDAEGREVLRESSLNYPANMEVNCDTKTISTYDDRGNLICVEKLVTTPNEPNGRNNQKEEWVYDEAGRLTFTRRTSKYPYDPQLDACREITYTYDEEGRLLEEVTVESYPADPQRDLLKRVTYAYDWEGRLIQTVKENTYTGEERQAVSGYLSTTTNTYDLFGRLKTSRLVWECSNVEDCFVQTDTYTYGSDGTPKGYTQTVKWQSPDTIPTVRTVTCNAVGLPMKEHTVSDLTNEWSEIQYAFFYNEGAQ